MKVTVEKNKKKVEKGWDEAKIMEWVDLEGVDYMIILTNGKHEGDENGTFEGTVLYNSDEYSIYTVGSFVKDWLKLTFKEVDQVMVSFVS